MPITGPKVQAPGGINKWFDVVQDERGLITSITPTQEAMQFFHSVQTIVFNESRSGPNTSRPTSTLDNRYIGMPYFDTTLNAPLRLQSVNPDVWSGYVSQHKSISQTTSNANTVFNDSDIAIPILSKEEFVGRIYMDVGASIKDTGIKVTMNAPTGSVGHIVAQLINDGQSAQEADTLRTDTIGAVLDFTTTIVGNTSLNGELQIAFHITNSTTAGSINLQWSQSTSTTTPLTVRVGSQMAAYKTA